jgi:hypothetical protein
MFKILHDYYNFGNLEARQAERYLTSLRVPVDNVNTFKGNFRTTMDNVLSYTT